MNLFHGLRLSRVSAASLGPPLTGHTDIVSSVAVNPAGTVVASASYDGSVRLWDVDRGQELRRFKGHGDDVGSLVFSPDRPLSKCLPGRAFSACPESHTIKMP